MGERKVLNKYFPPDFDPSKIPRHRQVKQQQMKVRMMLPMSIRCNTCGHYIYKGTKFNSHKENVIGHTYLGQIQTFRFYFKCTNCSAEITFKTAPQNNDYTVEAGATRNFEPWRAVDEALHDARKKRDTEEVGDAMKALENRTLESKKEMDIDAAIDEMRTMQARHATISTEDMLEGLRKAAELKEKELTEEDEAIIRRVIFHGSSKYVCGLSDDILLDMEDEDDELMEDAPSTKRRKMHIQEEISNSTLLIPTELGGVTCKPTFARRQRRVAFSIKPRSNISTLALPLTSKPSNAEQIDGGSGLTSLCATYDSDTSD